MATRESILVARAIFPEVLQKLEQHFTVESNQDDVIWPADELKARLQGKVGALITTAEPVGTALIAACPQLRIVANMAVGYNNLDIPALTAAGIQATNTPDVLTDTTADMAFTLVMAAARRVSESEAFLRAGLWRKWSYDMFVGPDVHGATLGILGMGRIGQAIAKRGAKGFGMPVIYHNRSRLAPEIEQELGARYVSKDELMAQSDHLVLVVPYSAATHHTIGTTELAQMKPTATLTNIGRGGLIDENALADTLAAGRIHAAGLDVFEGEPKINPRLLALKNVVLTPHIGSASIKTRKAMANLAADNLIAFFTQGKVLTPVNQLAG
ncbi:MAG: Glyoxylate/hydroxypyruvate reductase [Pseudomonadota bacterium]